MRGRRWMWIATLLVLSALLVPDASAATATGLRVEGVSHASGTGNAVFTVADERGLAWSATAASVVIERSFATTTTLDGPAAAPGRVYGKPESAVETYGHATLTGLRTKSLGAMLVTAAATGFSLASTQPSGIHARPVTDPVFQESPPVTAAGDTSDTDYSVHGTVDGAFAQLEAAGASYTLRGTLTLQVFAVDYLLDAGGAPIEEKTGYVEEARTATVSQGRIEGQRITLVDAVLRLDAPATSWLLSQDPRVDFVGSLFTEGGSGDLATSTLRRVAEDRYDGSGVLLLGAHGGALQLAPPPAAIESARVDVAGSAWLAPALVAGLMLAALVVVAVLSRRAKRTDDDVAAALVALEDGRHHDALAPLRRALLLRPDDAGLQLDLAICLEGTGDLAGARARYEATLRDAPAHAEALYYYARLLARLALHAESEAHLREALLLDPRLEEMARQERAFRGNTGVSR